MAAHLASPLRLSVLAASDAKLLPARRSEWHIEGERLFAGFLVAYLRHLLAAHQHASKGLHGGGLVVLDVVLVGRPRDAFLRDGSAHRRPSAACEHRAARFFRSRANLGDFFGASRLGLPGRAHALVRSRVQTQTCRSQPAGTASAAAARDLHAARSAPHQYTTEPRRASACRALGCA